MIKMTVGLLLNNNKRAWPWSWPLIRESQKFVKSSLGEAAKAAGRRKIKDKLDVNRMISS